MNRPDCGNQRTGHPRCAQLIAKTWNFSPATRRTQQGIFAVSPSDGFATGFRYVARRVWPSGNPASGPSESQDSYPGLRSRITGERIYRTIGTARIMPTAPLRRIPSFISIPRLESSSGEVIEFLLPVARHLHKVGPGIAAAARQAK